MKKLIFILLLVMVLGFATLSNATLWNRGGGLIYDSDLNITWLQDANLAATNTFGVGGISGGGTMTWDTANAWIAAMNTANYFGYNDWRLPKALPVNGVGYDYTILYDGSTDGSYNISAPGSAYPYSKASEMAYMHFINLGNLAEFDTAGNPQSGGGLTNTGPFINMQGYVYYTSEAVYDYAALAFYFGTGQQGWVWKTDDRNFAWAVRPGDVAVPEPATMLLLGLGLVGVAGVRRKLSY